MKFQFLALFSLCLALTACSKESSSNATSNLRTYAQEQLKMGGLITPDEIPSEDVIAASAECEAFRKTIPADWFQDFIEVPENYSQADGNKIKVFYYGKYEPEQTPIVFYNGGPGGTSWSSFRVINTTKNSFSQWKKLGFIFIDQRGQGCSDPTPLGSDEETLHRLENYGSKDIVKDSEMLRKKLMGDKKWKIFGQSYGAQIVHRYMVDAPEGIYSAHAHANSINKDPNERFMYRIGAQNRVLEEYFKQYPEDRILFLKLNNYLTPEVCFQDEETPQKSCGKGALAAFNSSLGFVNSWPRIHTWVNLLWNESGFNVDAMKEFLNMFHFEAANAPDKTYFQIVLAVVDRNFDADCGKTMELLRQRNLDVSQFLMHECMGEIQFPYVQSVEEVEARVVISKMKTHWLTNADFKAALQKNRNTPFYLYSGNLDTFVPMENFREELSEVSGLLFYKNFLGTGHDGFYNEPLVWHNLMK